jgi:Ca2+/H+ antiporter
MKHFAIQGQCGLAAVLMLMVLNAKHLIALFPQSIDELTWPWLLAGIIIFEIMLNTWEHRHGTD